MQDRSKLVLGSAQFGLVYGISNTEGQTSAEEVTAILAEALAHGIAGIDSAFAYGNAEEVLGHNDLSSFSVVSKYITPSKYGGIEQQLATTLNHLHVPSLYGYLAHRPGEILEDPQQWDILKTLRAKNLVKKIGFSLNTTNELEGLLAKSFFPDIVQVPYNYLDRRFEKLIVALKEKGCEIHSRSAFLQGLMFKDPESLPDFFAAVKPAIKKLQTLGNALPSALLHFVMENNSIDKIVMGVENLSQLHALIIAAQPAVTPALPVIDVQIPENILIPSRWPDA